MRKVELEGDIQMFRVGEEAMRKAKAERRKIPEKPKIL